MGILRVIVNTVINYNGQDYKPGDFIDFNIKPGDSNPFCTNAGRDMIYKLFSKKYGGNMDKAAPNKSFFDIKELFK